MILVKNSLFPEFGYKADAALAYEEVCVSYPHTRRHYLIVSPAEAFPKPAAGNGISSGNSFRNGNMSVEIEEIRPSVMPS